MFSVIIPAFNCENTLAKVLDSVKNQTRFDLIDEIIVINDGSTDTTKEVIVDYVQNNPQVCIQYKEQKNRGVSYTRNRGIKEAKSEWIALLDADDLWLPNKIERQVSCIEKNPDICFLGTQHPLRFLGASKKGLYKVSPQELCVRNCPSTPSVVFKRDVAIKLGLFDEQRNYGEDIQFFQKFMLQDSYYILAEKLVEISFVKKYFAQSGLSSNLKEMHKGRNDNTRELYQMGLISKPYLILMLCLNQLKYVRRRGQQSINRLRKGK